MAGLRPPVCPCVVACRSQAALRGAQWQDRGQRSGGNMGKCWSGKQDNEVFLRVGRDLGACYLGKLWDSTGVSKFGWIRLWGTLANVEVRPALSMMVELQRPLPNKNFLHLYDLVFIEFFFFNSFCCCFVFVNAWFIYRKNCSGNSLVSFWHLFAG